MLKGFSAAAAKGLGGEACVEAAIDVAKDHPMASEEVAALVPESPPEAMLLAASRRCPEAPVAPARAYVRRSKGRSRRRSRISKQSSKAQARRARRRGRRPQCCFRPVRRSRRRPGPPRRRRSRRRRAKSRLFPKNFGPPPLSRKARSMRPRARSSPVRRGGAPPREHASGGAFGRLGSERAAGFRGGLARGLGRARRMSGRSHLLCGVGGDRRPRVRSSWGPAGRLSARTIPFG